MLSQFIQLRNKEIICVKDGLKIGFVDDIEFDPETWAIEYFVSYGKSRFFGLFGRYDDIKIQCSQIQVIGEDIILVNDYVRDGKVKTKKENFWNKLFE